MEGLYTNQQKMRARKARDLHHLPWAPSTHDLKSIITQNLIKDDPITIQDMDLATQICRPDIGSIKGMSTRRKPTPAMNNMIELPQELINRTFKLIMYIDIITINTCKFITIITSELYYCTMHYIKSTKTDEFTTGIQEAFRIYRNTQYIIIEVRCDNKFSKTLMKLQNHFKYKFLVSYYNPQEDVPAAERNNCTIRDRCRVKYHSFPYN